MYAKETRLINRHNYVAKMVRKLYFFIGNIYGVPPWLYIINMQIIVNDFREGVNYESTTTYDLFV